MDWWAFDNAKNTPFWGTQYRGVGYLGRTEGHQDSPTYRKVPLFSPSFSLKILQTNSGVPKAASRASRPEISFPFTLISSLSKSTVDHSSHLSTLTWRPRSGPSWHRRSQDLMRSSSEPTKTPSSRYQECC